MHGVGSPERPLSLHLHVGLVVLPNLLDTHIIFGINEGLSSGICLSQCHNTCNILEVMLIVYLDLWVFAWYEGSSEEWVYLEGCVDKYKVDMPRHSSMHNYGYPVSYMFTHI